MNKRRYLLFLCLIALLFPVIASSKEQTSEPSSSDSYIFVTSWGSKGSGDGQFRDITGIAIDLNGYIYVADRVNGNIQKFDTSGKFITKWIPPTYDEILYSPRVVELITVSPKGTIYAYDHATNTLGWIYNEDYTEDFKETIKLLNTDKVVNYPAALALDAEGKLLYVADMVGNCILKFGFNGLVGQFGIKGSNNGELYGPIGIAVSPDGYVYVSDGGNYRIQKFDTSGKFITKWGKKGTSDGEFAFPRQLSLDAEGYVYVPDYENNNVQKFDSSGKFIIRIGSYGFKEGQFFQPIGVVVDKDGNVYVADSGMCRIQKFAPKHQ